MTIFKIWPTRPSYLRPRKTIGLVTWHRYIPSYTIKWRYIKNCDLYRRTYGQTNKQTDKPSDEHTCQNWKFSSNKGAQVWMSRKSVIFVKMRSKCPRGKKMSSEGRARALKIVFAGGVREGRGLAPPLAARAARFFSRFSTEKVYFQ